MQATKLMAVTLWNLNRIKKNSVTARLSDKFAHLKCVARLPYEILTSEHKRQFETDIVINDKSQGIVSRHLILCGIFNENKFTIESAYERILKPCSQHLAKLQERKSIASRALCALAMSCWKIKNLPDILSMTRNSCW